MCIKTKQVVYVAPLKALVRERMKDWKAKFVNKLGKKVRDRRDHSFMNGESPFGRENLEKRTENKKIECERARAVQNRKNKIHKERQFEIGRGLCILLLFSHYVYLQRVLALLCFYCHSFPLSNPFDPAFLLWDSNNRWWS